MAITFRGTKGSPLSHDELDQNFRELYYSSSLLGTSQSTYGLVLYRSSSLDAGETIYLPTARGDQFGIQVKSGSDNISSSFFTSSNDFTYDYVNKHLSVSGSGHFSGSVTVLGTLTATQFETVLVSSSIQYASGSNQFGNSADDNQVFTGSILHLGSQTTTAAISANNFTGSSFTGSFSGSLLADNGVLSSSAQIATDITGSSTSLSSSLAGRITTNENDIDAVEAEVDGLLVVTASYATTGSNTFVGNQIISGALESTGVFTLPNIANVSASLASALASATGFPFTGSAGISGSLTVTGSVAQTGSNFRINIASPASEVTPPSGYGAKYFLDFKNVDALTPDWNGMRLWAYNTTGSRSLDNRLSMRKCYSVGGTAQYWSELYNSGYELGAAKKSISGSYGYIRLITEEGSGSVTANISSSLITLDAASGVQITGSLTVDNDITAFHSSDERLKDNITPIDGALDKIKQIDGYEFDWNSSSEHSGHDVGVIAQEIEKVLPEIVVTRDNGYKAVRYEKIVALLIKAIKEQQLQIDELKSKI